MSDHEEVVEDDNEALRATTYAVAMDEVAFNPEHAVGLVSGTTRDSELRSNDSDGAIEVGGVTGKRGGGSAGDVRTKVVAPAKEMAAAVMNFINSIVGAGIIGLPYALKQCGFFMGIILISCVAQMTAYSVNLLVRNGNHVKKFDYEELCEHTLGKPGFYTVSVFMAILAYGAMIAYFIVIGDTMTTIFQGVDQSFSVPILHERTFVISLIAVVVVLPLIMLKDMSKLSFSSGLSVLADVFLVIIVVARAPTAATPGLVAANISDSADAGSGSLFSFANPNLFGGIGAISFAYVCQHSSFIVHNTLTPGPARQSRWNKVTHISIGVALFLCLVLAIGGYVTFGESTQADILNNFGCTDVAINIARVLLAVTMFFTYPMEQFVVRHSVHAIICRGKGKVEDHNVRYYVITCLLYVSRVNACGGSGGALQPKAVPCSMLLLRVMVGHYLSRTAWTGTVRLDALVD